jgi:hypothetical protein
MQAKKKSLQKQNLKFNMKIKVVSDFLKLKGDLDSLSFKEKNKDSLSIKLFEKTIEKLNQKEIKIDNSEWKKEFSTLKFPEEQTIQVLYVDNKKVFDYFEFQNNSNIIGLHCITTGDGILSEESYYSEKFTILVFANDKYLKEFLDEEIQNDEHQNYLQSYLNSYVNTLTHELVHALEFMENSGGLSPHDVDCCYDASEFDYSINDCITGYGLPNYEKDYENVIYDQEIKDIMEERVEEKGRKLLKSLSIDFEKIYKIYSKPQVENSKNKKASI